MIVRKDVENYHKIGFLHLKKYQLVINRCKQTGSYFLKYELYSILMVSDRYVPFIPPVVYRYVHRDLPRFTGVQLGQTDVILRDANMAGLGGPHSTRGPSAGVHVVLPARMEWLVYPGGVWVLERTRRYQMSVELSDRLKHRIMLQDDVKLDTVMDTKHFKVSLLLKLVLALYTGFCYVFYLLYLFCIYSGYRL